MIASGYLRALALSVVTWLGLFLAFTWAIDPYGVSPLRLGLNGINALKPKRLAIDRIVKPYEVWRYQPRTIFLGSSRLHQSLDPAVLDGTRFAPAYNAAIPNGSMQASADDLERYVRLDPNLRTVIVEVWPHTFLGGAQDRRPKTGVETWSELATNAVVLLGSADTLWDSWVTLAHNALRGPRTNEILPGGNMGFRERRGGAHNFDGYETWFWGTDASKPEKLVFDLRAVAAFRDVIEIARANNLELIFVATPNHAFVDYSYEAIAGWAAVEECLTTLSGLATIYSFSQPNPWVYEPVSAQLAYWNDPLHPSLGMGRGMLANLAGLPVAGLPGNFIERLTPERVASHIESRRQGARAWAQTNPAFVNRFEDARRKWQATNVPAKSH
jgi:hypothetical protein